jgi:hypothetical protein
MRPWGHEFDRLMAVVWWVWWALVALAIVLGVAAVVLTVRSRAR